MIRLKAHDYLKFTHNGENSGMNNKKIKSDNEISELCSFSLGGYQQKVLIEGKSKDNPIVITLHGGQGTPIPFSVGCRGLNKIMLL